jgi:hypothetical protein
VEALPLTLALYLEGIGELIRDCPLTLTLSPEGRGELIKNSFCRPGIISPDFAYD